MTYHAYVLGHPVAHSKSPAMHNAAYKALGVDWEYGLADCPVEDDARTFLARDDWRLLNVTMPYKPLALASADEATAAARIASGANVLVRRTDGTLWADNTDGVGCVAYLQRHGVDFDDARVAVCGTGPTAISITHAVLCAQARSVALFSRNARRAAEARERYTDALCQAAGSEDARVGDFPDRLNAFAYEDSPFAIESADVIIDATSLGMHAGDPAPFDTALLSSDQVVFDVVYGHGETALIHAAREAGCKAFDGEGMLVAQAVETVRDVAVETGAFALPADFDLFSIMAQAAGFSL